MNQMLQALYKGGNQQINGETVSSDSTILTHEGPHHERHQDEGSENGVQASDMYRKVQHGADIPFFGLQMPAPEKPKDFRHPTSDVIRQSLPVDQKDRRKKEEERRYRKKRLEELSEELRRAKLVQETEQNLARRHHDFLSPAHKSPISPDRFEDALACSWEPQSTEPNNSHNQSHILPASPLRQTGSTGTSPLRQTGYTGTSPLRQTGYTETSPFRHRGYTGTSALEHQGFTGSSPLRHRGYQVRVKAKAMYNFAAHNQRELSFKKGDTIYLLREVGKNWFEGEHYGQVGIVPANYLQVFTNMETTNGMTGVTEGQARANFDFPAQTSLELTLKKGDVVAVLRRVDKNWLEGQLGDQRGIFPVSYVTIIQEPQLISPIPSLVTSPMTGTPEILSPMSSDAPTSPLHPSPLPPPHPSPSSPTSFFHEHATSTPGLQQTCKFTFNSHSQERNDFPEFIPYKQSRYSNLSSSKLISHEQTRDAVISSLESIPNSQARNSNLGSPKLIPYEQMKFPSLETSFTESELSTSWPDFLHLEAEEIMQNLDINLTPKTSAKVFNDCSSVTHDDDLAIRRYKVIHPHSPRHKDELELEEDDDVYVTEKRYDGWYVGTSGRTFEFGTFPGSCVQLLE